MATAVQEKSGAKPATPRASAGPSRWTPKHNPWAIALTVTLATFMEVLDTSIANVALPHIAGGLGASEDEATWVLTSYLVANAIILPASAYLTTFLGRKRFYMICVVLFGLSSALCGIAPSLPLLIFFRVLQGAGGGGLAPSEQAILADTFPPRKRGQAFAVYGMAVVAAPALGPSLGGWITDNFDWRWIFFINVPVALVSLFFTSRLVEDPPHIVREVAANKLRGLNLDYFGFSLLALDFGSLEFVLDKGQEDDWFGSGVITFFTVMCVLALAALIWWSISQTRKGRHPILSLALFKNRNFAAVFSLMFVLGFVLYGTTVLIPQFLQALLGYTAELAGFAISPGGFTVMLLMPLVGYLVQHRDPRYLIATGFIMTTLALIQMRELNLQISFWHAVGLRIFQASGLAFLFVPINTLAYTGVPMEYNNDVSGLTNLARNIGGSVGTSFLVTMLARREQFHQTRLGNAFSQSNPIFQQRLNALQTYLAGSGGRGGGRGALESAALGNIYNQLQAQTALLSYIDVITILAVFAALMVPICFLLKKRQSHGAPAMH